MKSLKDKVIWVTGASAGIGEALAIELGNRGAKVALTARREDLLNALVSSIKSEGGAAFSFSGDVRDLASMKKLASRIEEEVGPIDILVANAGTHIFTRPEEFNSSEYLYLMDLNYGGILRCIEAVVPSMLKRGQGHIVGVASVAGYRGLPRAAAYGASKAAIIHFLESIRFHLRRCGLVVTICNPGFVKTPLTDKNDFRMPFLVPAEKAAKWMADGIEREKLEITFPFIFAWFMKLCRVAPFPLYDRIVNRLWRQ